MQSATSSPPRRLAIAVACVASAMLLLEIVVTRIYSVLFYYHFSFFAVSLVMSGLVLGGILAARFDPRDESEEIFEGRLSVMAAAFSGGTMAALLVLSRFSPAGGSDPSLATVALYAVIFLPGLVPAGAFLALAFARNKTWIGRLYAWDLVAAAIACISAIFLLRTLHGPAVLVVPGFLGALGAVAVARTQKHKIAGGALAAFSILLLVGNVATDNELLSLRPGPAKLFERWNEHSRIQSFENADGRALIIDRSAATTMRPVPDAKAAPIVGDTGWARGPQYQVYDVGRPVDKVAIIGVGGGQDVQAALLHEAKHVDGYELNGILVGLFKDQFRDFNTLLTRPDVSLIHSEGRVGIAHSGAQYDVIQASLIDTWAATASGGFVLSENGLYTREGWRIFLTHLSDTGILTMTRWYLPNAPAETHRLVALAASALADIGIADPRPHLILLGPPRDKVVGEQAESAGATTATILVSRTAFRPDEIAKLSARCAELSTGILVGPGIKGTDPVFDQLLDPSTRQKAIADSRFNITPPDDLQPYFFLQMRPSDLVNLGRSEFGMVTEITFNGVRVLMMLGACALLMVVLVVAFTMIGTPGARAERGDRRVFRLMSLYFLGIGFGYIMIQLGLHQRLILVLGHPTLAFSVILFSMLLGTGVGATLSTRLFPEGRLRVATGVIVGTLAVLWLGLPLFPHFEAIGSVPVRIGAVALLVLVIGVVLGFAFPLGVRITAPTGESAVQKLWAINGAASIAASILASILGLTMGTGTVLLVGLLSYVVAAVAGTFAEARPVEAK